MFLILFKFFCKYLFDDNDFFSDSVNIEGYPLNKRVFVKVFRHLVYSNVPDINVLVFISSSFKNIADQTNQVDRLRIIVA